MIFLDFISAKEQNEPVCSFACVSFAPRCCDHFKTSYFHGYTRYCTELVETSQLLHEGKRGGSSHSPKLFPYPKSEDAQLYQRSGINPNPITTASEYGCSEEMQLLNKPWSVQSNDFYYSIKELRHFSLWNKNCNATFQYWLPKGSRRWNKQYFSAIWFYLIAKNYLIFLRHVLNILMKLKWNFRKSLAVL